ncbi:MAG: FliM/FliN family flagellar motor C-terminal domain-containing protein [Phycisphaerae bacterium]
MSPKADSAIPALLERLRQAARRLGPPPEPPPDVTAYDWSRPHHFTAAAHRRLSEVARRLQRELSKALAHLLKAGTVLAADPPDECYPAAVDDNGAACYVPLRDAAGTPCGALRFPTSLATAWVECLLGGTPSARAGGEDLSPLEAGLLLDIASWMTRAVSEALAQAGAGEVRHEPSVTGWAEALPTDDSTELCRFVFREMDPAAAAAAQTGTAETADGPRDGAQGGEEASDETDAPGADAEADFADAGIPDATEGSDDGPSPTPADRPPAPALVLTSRFLEPLAESDPDARSGPADPEAFKRGVRARIEAAPVTMKAELGTASVPLGDFLALEPGDVIVLDRQCGETIDLAVGNQVVLRARPVVTAGRYGVDVQDLRRQPRLELAV